MGNQKRQLKSANSGMRRRYLAALVCLFFAHGLSCPLLAQVYRVQNYEESDGLPSSDVYGIVQSADGQMWFSTRNGVARYDGRNWVNFGPSDGLPVMNQEFLAIDNQDRIWAMSGRPQVRIAIYEDGHWQELPQQFNATIASSLLTLDGESHRALVGHSCGIVLVVDATQRNLDFEGGISPSVFGLERFGETIYAATSDGLFELNLDEPPELRKVKDCPSVSITALTHDPVHDRLWLVGQDWIGTFDGKQWSKIEEPFDDLSFKLNLATTAIAGPNGELFFGSNSSLFSYRPSKGIELLGLKNGMVGEGARDLFRDRDGLLWASCARGVSKIVSFAFANYDRENGLFGDEVSAVLHRSDGTTILGHLGGITVFDDQPIKTIPLGPIRTTRVQDIAEDSKGNLWIAASQSGVFKIDKSGAIQHFPDQSDWGFVNSVLVDRDDEIWIAAGNGIFKLQGNRFLAYRSTPEMSDFCLRRICLDRQGRIVAVTSNRGIWRNDPDGWKNWSSSRENLTNNLFAFLDRENGQPLIGTIKGLCTLEGDRIVKIREPNIDRPVYFIVKDNQNRLLIGTDNGVFCWDGTRLRQFTVEQGLAGRETNRATGQTDAHNRTWIGTAKGLSIYRSHLDFGPFQPPHVEIIRAASGDESWNPENTHTISHLRNALTFDYRAISYVDEQEIQIRSRLVGLEEDWQFPERSRHWRIQYNFLPPGKYRLNLQAANSDGDWSQVASSEEITILPPFWRKSWFYAIVLIGVAGIGFFSHRFFNQRRYLRQLKQEVVARVAELQHSESRFGVTLSSIADGVLTIGLTGEVRYMNPAARRIVGKSLENNQTRMLNKLLASLGCSEPDRNDLFIHVDAGTTWTSTLQFEKGNGETRLIEAGTAPLRNSNEKLLGAVVVIRDVTEKVRLENELVQSQRLASLGTLAGGIAHDFNNLLAVIKWNLPTMQHDSAHETQINSIKLVDDAMSQATRLTEQIITFSKGGTPDLQVCLLNGLIRNSITLVAHQADMQFELDLSEDLKPVEVDSVQISQVLSNILVNACQAMPTGGLIRVVAQNRLGPQADSWEVEIAIQDQGAGIPPNELRRVFEPYFTTKANGYGIGLATCYSIIQKHNGRLWVESDVGIGSTFRIRLPASNHAVPVLDSVSPLRVDHQLANRILVVDDDELVRKSLTAILKTAKFQVVTVPDGNEAIRVYRQEYVNGRRFHAALIDFTMPGGIDGCETIRQLVEIDPKVHGIVISGYSDEQVLANYQSFGFVDRLQKPCSLEDLLQALGKRPINTDQSAPEFIQSSSHVSPMQGRDNTTD